MDLNIHIHSFTSEWRQFWINPTMTYEQMANGKWQIEKVFFWHDTNIYIFTIYHIARKKFTTFEQCIISFQKKNSIFWNLQKIGIRSTWKNFKAFRLVSFSFYQMIHHSCNHHDSFDKLLELTLFFHVVVI